jgi:hypothetical protein
MAYIIVDDFKAGLDQRKSIITAPPGALYTANNVHLTRGAELQKRMAFVPAGTVPPDSVGLVSCNDTLYVFGPTPPTVAMPANVVFVQITHPTEQTLVRIVSWTLFQGKPYILAAYADGSVLHFYNGQMISTWYGTGSLANYTAVAVLTMGTKVYVAANSSLIFSEDDNAMNWNTNVNGSGTIDMSTNYAGFETLTGLGVYINHLVIYSKHACQIWYVDPDPLQNQIIQTIPNLGTLAANSVQAYGDSDNFVLALTGIRSLRARDMSNIAGAYDIGTPIDNIVNPYVRANPSLVPLAQSVLDPIDGRYLLAIGSTVFVFSYFQTDQISAWTTYDMGATVEAWAVVDAQLYCRIGNNILLYGGPNYDQWDNSLATVQMPYLSAGKPATLKSVMGVDAAITGTWNVALGLLPQPPYLTEQIGTLTSPTFGLQKIPVNGQGTHMMLTLTSSAPVECKIGQIIIIFDTDEVE